MKAVFFVLSCLSAILLGSGCIAFNVGNPKTETRTESVDGPFDRVVSRTFQSANVELLDVTADRPARINRVEIGVSGVFETTRQQYLRYNRVEVTTQRKMSFGLFPVWAEKIWKPEKASDPWEYPIILEGGGSNCILSPILGIMGTIVGNGLATGLASLCLPYSILVEPFYGNYDVLKARDRDRFPETPYVMVPFGFHRYHTKIWGRSVSPLEQKYHTPKTSLETCRATGPFNVRLVVPEISFSKIVAVPSGCSTATFELPMGVESHVADIEIRFLFPDTDGETGSLTPDSRAILENAVGTRYMGQIELTGAPPLILAQPQTSFVTITNVVIEKVVLPTSPMPPKAPYDIVTKEPYADGRATFLVTVKDESKTKFDIESEVGENIKRQLRNEFLADNPNMEESEIRTYVSSVFNPDGTITMRGIAVSMELVPDSWEYDPVEHKGSLRLRVHSRMSTGVAKELAAKSIGELVKDKGVAIEVGKAPPPGAKYKILTDEFRGGVLTITFKVVD